MTPERWRQVKDILQGAMDRAPGERAAFLDRSCGQDAALRHEVESLLAADDPMARLLETPAAVVAGVVLPRRGAGTAGSTRTPNPDEGNAFVSLLTDALAGRYTIGRELGRGGMATVYLASDLRHDRPVALKVLLPELAAVLGTERFLSEIRVTAKLQHPHLLPLFDSGEAAGQLYYTMPYVEGESLRARLERERQLPVDEAVRIAVAVAGALDYAHRNGVVHRDLKPENILLQDGQPVVADFGIALAVARAGGARVTQSGISLGTPHYMAPEQATADPHLDARADVYALGCVLYELLTGEPPHTGSNVQAVIARILTDEPRPVRAIRRAVPPHVEAAIATALEKLPADRWPTARAFADALEGRVVAAPTPGRGLRPGPRTAAGLARVSQQPVVVAAWTISLLMVGAAGILAGRWWQQRSARPVTPVQFTLSPPEVTNVRAMGGPSWGPDGRSLAYYAPAGKGYALYYRRLDELQARRLAGSDERFDALFFSPDGQWIAVKEASGTLKKVPINGGTPVTITTALSGISERLRPWGPATRTRDNTVVLGSLGAGLVRLSAAGGSLEPVTTLDSARGERAHINPVVLPNDRSVAFSILYSEQRRPARTGVVDLRTKSRVTLDLPGGAPIGYLEGRLLVGGDDHTLLAVPFDLEHGRLTGAPATVLEDVLANPIMGTVSASVSDDGSLAYVRGREARRLVLVDERGDVVGSEQEERRDMFGARFSPDGRRVAIAADAPGSRSAANDAAGIWVWDVASGAFSRVTTRGRAYRPAWTPDGRRIAYSADMDGRRELWWVPADGSGPEARLFGADSLYLEWPQFSPDGRTVVFDASPPGANGPSDVWVLQLGDTTGRSAHPLFQTPFDESQPRISPDGKWLAYMSTESGGPEVYVRPFPGPGGRVQVSSGGGQWPIWVPNGHRLLYAKGDTTISVDLALPASPTSAQAVSVVGRQFVFSAGPKPFRAIEDIHPDGRRFVGTQNAGEPPALVIVVNWLTELRARIGAAAR